MKKRFLVLSIVACIALVFSLSGNALALQVQDGKQIVVIGGRQPAPDIDPSHKTDYSRRMLQQALYDGLYKYVGSPVKLVPWLAERHEVSSDARVWTVHMVRNARFHNGDKVTAEAVKWSIIRPLKLSQGPSWMLSDVLDINDIEIVDDYTLCFKLKYSYAPFLSVLPWFYIMNPKEVIAHEKDGDYGQAWLKDHEAGSGPYRMARWQHGVMYEMTAVPDYWKGWPNPNHPHAIVYKLIRETSSMKIGLQKGQLDLAGGLSPDDLDVLEGYKGVRVTNDPGITPLTIKMNTQKGYTKDINIRKAICHAVDYDSVLKVFNNKAILMDSPFPIGLKGHVATDAYRYDLDKAREYLKKSGYPNGGFELEYVYVQGLDSEKKVGLLLIDNLAKLNIKVKMVPLTWPNMTARGSKVESSPDMMAIFATPKFNDSDAVAYQYHKNSWGRYYGTSFYTNEKVWELIDQARSISDWDQRQPIYKRIQDMVMEDAPEIFLVQMNRQFAMRDHLKGFQFCPLRLTNESDLYPLYIGK